ncbi:hypothetical protein AB0P21_32765 [Kribbella sp. NPDC056861]|uniref:hypothetical protein n=1 Tax=Kribbella sp. NPDC056861 TaxID=3154857 RepID=UPI003436A594
MSLQWSRGGDLLRLQTLGWFPLLVTVGPVGRTSRAHRDAIARLVAAARAKGGKTLSDSQLVGYLPQAELRWQRALSERVRLSRAEQILEARRCPRCRAWVENSATHCAGCRHRFTPAEDEDRDQLTGQARATITSAERVLSELARGVLLNGLAPPDQDQLSVQREEATSVVMRRG